MFCLPQSRFRKDALFVPVLVSEITCKRLEGYAVECMCAYVCVRVYLNTLPPLPLSAHYSCLELISQPEHLRQGAPR